MAQGTGEVAAIGFAHRALWISTSILSILFVVSIYVVLPRNVLSSTLTESVKTPINSVWPQGWGFFTKDPDSPTMDVYKATSVTSSLLVTPQMRAQNLFGLSRSARAQGPEMAILNTLIDSEDWQDCGHGRGRGDDGCVHDALQQPAKSLINASPVATVCGDLVLTMEKATPWAYRNLVSEPYRILRAVHVSVVCTRGDG